MDSKSGQVKQKESVTGFKGQMTANSTQEAQIDHLQGYVDLGKTSRKREEQEEPVV